MCAYSMVMDAKFDNWRDLQDRQQRPFEFTPTYPLVTSPITQREIDEFRRLLDRAREYDRKMNQPDCEMEEKKEKLRKLAAELGIADKLSFLDDSDADAHR